MMIDGSELNAGDPSGFQRGFLSRNGFSLLIGAAVLVTSFGYGISVGLSRNLSRAEASSNLWGAPFGAEYELRRITLPQGVKLVPVGDELALNGKAAEMASFISSRGVEEILKEIIAGWEAQGLFAVGAASRRRGVAFAVNRSTGESFSASAWIVPPSYRKVASEGRPVQGFIAVGLQDQESRALPEEAEGLVPGVPLPPDGRPGAVLSSKDPRGRSYTGTYTNPGGVEQNMEFYRTELRREGWHEADLRTGKNPSQGGSMIMQRNGKELVLLFSDMQPKHTLVTVALGAQPAS